jgi:hypothetical protein
MCRLQAAKEFQNILSENKKIKIRSVGLSCRHVSQPKLSELVIFICLSTGQISCHLFKSCRLMSALSSNSIAHNGFGLCVRPATLFVRRSASEGN